MDAVLSGFIVRLHVNALPRVERSTWRSRMAAMQPAREPGRAAIDSVAG
ncbi:hypothetical protein [Burkholderia contaminans]|nr:hypothetical protein [Burkholderia contaminans]